MNFERSTPKESMPDEIVLRKSVDNPALFSILIDKYQLPFLRKAQGIVHSQEEAEDIVQETFTKIYLNAKKFKKQPGVEFKSWAWRILVNTSLTHYRKLKKRFGDVGYLDTILSENNDEAGNLDESFGKIESPKQAFEAVLDRNERAAEVREAINVLPAEAADLLKSHYIDDRPYSEIAKKYGITIGALKMKLFRARKVLKDVLKEI